MTKEKNKTNMETPNSGNVLKFADEVRAYNPNVSLISMLYLKYQISMGIDLEAVEAVAKELGLDEDEVNYWLEITCEDYKSYNEEVSGEPVKKRGRI